MLMNPSLHVSDITLTRVSKPAPEPQKPAAIKPATFGTNKSSTSEKKPAAAPKAKASKPAAMKKASSMKAAPVAVKKQTSIKAAVSAPGPEVPRSEPEVSSVGVDVVMDPVPPKAEPAVAPVKKRAIIFDDEDEDEDVPMASVSKPTSPDRSHEPQVESPASVQPQEKDEKENVPETVRVKRRKLVKKKQMFQDADGRIGKVLLLMDMCMFCMYSDAGRGCL